MSDNSSNPIRKISVNPDLFKVSGKTRKKEPNSNNPSKIKIKTPKKTSKTLKRSVLQFIRNHQENKLKHLLNTSSSNTNTKSSSSSSMDTNSHMTDTFQTDFQGSLDYLEKISKENEMKINPKSYPHQQNIHNQTLKKYENNNIQSVLYHPSTPIHGSPLNQPSSHHPPHLSHPPYKYHQPIVPQYGCLKNGTLPTWKVYNQKNYTQKNHHPNSSPPPNLIFPKPTHSPPILSPNMNIEPIPFDPFEKSSPLSVMNTSISKPKSYSNTNTNMNINENNQQKINELLPMREIQKNIKKAGEKPKLNKQKKTFTRTYKVGKSKVYPKISVLVSNKTIRRNIDNKTQLLKQVPIQEVKKYLIKKGFIRIGSIAPNDVLRKMYETSLLMCGEIQNHNPDNLLYNYLNSNEN